MLRKAVLLACVTVVGSPHSQLVLYMLASYAFIVVALRTHPYTGSRLYNGLEYFALSVNNVVATLLLILLDYRSEVDTIAGVFVGVCFLSFVVVVGVLALLVRGVMYRPGLEPSGQQPWWYTLQMAPQKQQQLDDALHENEEMKRSDKFGDPYRDTPSSMCVGRERNSYLPRRYNSAPQKQQQPDDPFSDTPPSMCATCIAKDGENESLRRDLAAVRAEPRVTDTTRKVPTHAELEKDEEMREALEAYRVAASWKPLPRARSDEE